MKKDLLALHKNMLIVCEGEVTEPEYFRVLKRLALKEGIWDTIEIIPKPRSESAGEEEVPSPHKSPRNKRMLKVVEMLAEADAVEEGYNWRQTPVKFVKEARDGLKDNIFEEVWAVFDKNGHPAHAQAFQLARETIGQKQVNIAFSSIAFEHWILLHFEKNETAFVKSECKDGRGKYLECGTGSHENDCRGVRCVSGYLRINQYLTNSTKIHNNVFRKVLDQLTSLEIRKTAYENAAWLRHVVNFDAAEPYLANPFTTVDFLVKRLLGEDDLTFEWADIGQMKDWQSLRIWANFEAGKLSLEISNLGSVTRLLNGVDIGVFLRQDGNLHYLQPVENSKIFLAVGETNIFSFRELPEFLSLPLEIKAGSHRLLID